MTATYDRFDTVNQSAHNGTTTIEQAILEAIAEARQTCELSGDGSPNCAVAWDIVEELQAEKSHKQQAKQRKTSLESFCDMHPEALECLIYDV
ncbi:Calvin cycle protein CP12 [Nostoc sp. FACHB-152]|uniref:Calvin cycle protein CP12 n=1 Tax=unclassified Nostoc TaxID=2593658 RepID=UPI0016878D54|nr:MULTISPECIES: Calvin cycle protein CP12 [unclassified Nostoc]MBD2446539.1 Calvin cycle protein CP12 [Nostoc sp. FACHB-152]MBD2468664.1 Calvin cycle protein CP12 [Nostoc sp. FACHB-145]